MSARYLSLKKRYREMVILVILGISAVALSTNGWALRRHTLIPEEGFSTSRSEAEALPSISEEGKVSGSKAPQGGTEEPSLSTGAPKKKSSYPYSPGSHSISHPKKPLEAADVLPEAEQRHEEMPKMGAQRGLEAEEHIVLPHISPIPGVSFVETLINLMDHELHGRFLGWRPNDLIIGRLTDNINNYQLGVLEAVRFTTLRLKDSLTRMGEADSYDRDLEDALNLFMNKATLFWFPSAENSYSEAIDHLRKFLEKLKTGQRNFYYRVDNLQSLIATYGDLLGNVNRTLTTQHNPDGSPISWFDCDDYFYYAKGVAHVMFEILKVVRVGFEDQLITLDAVDIMDEILHELHTAEQLSPWIILNSKLDGTFANHRANLNAPLSEAAHLMVMLSRL